VIGVLVASLKTFLAVRLECCPCHYVIGSPCGICFYDRERREHLWGDLRGGTRVIGAGSYTTCTTCSCVVKYKTNIRWFYVTVGFSVDKRNI
jgi:hypothetical protein